MCWSSIRILQIFYKREPLVIQRPANNLSYISSHSQSVFGCWFNIISELGEFWAYVHTNTHIPLFLSSSPSLNQFPLFAVDHWTTSHSLPLPPREDVKRTPREERKIFSKRWNFSKRIKRSPGSSRAAPAICTTTPWNGIAYHVPWNELTLVYPFSNPIILNFFKIATPPPPREHFHKSFHPLQSPNPAFGILSIGTIPKKNSYGYPSVQL